MKENFFASPPSFNLSLSLTFLLGLRRLRAKLQINFKLRINILNSFLILFTFLKSFTTEKGFPSFGFSSSLIPCSELKTNDETSLDINLYYFLSRENLKNKHNLRDFFKISKQRRWRFQYRPSRVRIYLFRFPFHAKTKN